ncbi:MAG: membrane protein insertase YidC [Lentisphaeria bacterium]|nr:membrane protein insertase YidC [Lentisphaeria bacterium]
MKFDKELLVGFALCALILFGWGPLSRYMGWQTEPEQTAVTAAAESEKTPGTAPAKTTEKPVAEIEKKQTVIPAAVVKTPPFTVENEDVIFHIDPMAGAVTSITMKKFLNAERSAAIQLDQTRNQVSGIYAVSSPNSAWNLLKVQVEKQPRSAAVIRVFRNAAGQLFQIRQAWELPEKGYSSEYQLTFSNLEKTPVALGNIIVNGGDLPSWAEASGDTIRVASHRFDFLTAKNKFMDIDADEDDDDFYVVPAPAVKWAGLGNKYFATVLTADGESFLLNQSRKVVNGEKGKDYIISMGAVLKDVTLSADKSERFQFRSYCGPKEAALLSAFEPSCARMMHLAWGPLDYLARFLLWILVKLHALIGSYGWSIILLTLIVRTVFYPVTAKANVSMKKMQAVGPKIQALREKYKDNPQMLNMKTMELYREEKVNPFGGCLPILLQIPVFFALYATLEGAVQLRQVPFLWCKDLAGPDTIFTIPLYFVNLPFNPLVLAMTGLMIIQQRMTPMSADPMQKKMMMAMPIVMLLFLYNLPSGLTLYWTVSNLFSIVQLKLQQRTTTPAAAKEA